MISRYLNPRNDFAFRKTFGEEKHKRIPIAFLNSVFHLEGDKEIVDLEFLNPAQNPEVRVKKESIVDVLVRDQKGDKYIIEMQVAKVSGFEKRAQYYACKAYTSLFARGDDYHVLKKVIFLAITDYEVFPEKTGYKSDHIILDNKTYEHDLQDFWFTFVELPKFTKTLDDCTTLEDKWYYFLKHANEPENMNVLIESSPEIKEAYAVLDQFNWTEAELQAYDDAGLAIADQRGALIAAREDGIVEGKAELIRTMHASGASIETISQMTKLSVQQIQNLM